MKKKKLYLMLIILVLVISSSLALQCLGFQIGPLTDEEIDKDDAEFRAMQDDKLAIKEAERLIAEHEAAKQKAGGSTEAELLEGFEEEEKLIPDEPITYSGNALGLYVVLIVNFKTAEVTGSISLSGDDYVDATITNGKIKIETFEITANFSGIMGSKKYGAEYPFDGIIAGKVSEDLSTFIGDIRDDEGDGGKFTIYK